MSRRPLHPLAALAGAAILSLGLAGAAVAQEEATPTPVPAAESASELRSERQAAREERQAAREERKAAKDERKAQRDAAKEIRAVERQAAKDTRKADRAAGRAAKAQVREACAAELEAVRADTGLDRSARREALREARVVCQELYLAARAQLARREVAIDALYTQAASDGTGVVRTDLGIAEPGSAPGQELGLWHYLIPAGAELAAHTHPGWQLARVTDGELEYTVVEGEGILLRADGSDEPIGPGTYVLATGDGVIENPELIHLGANRTDEPVTLISATLFEAGQPISTVAEDEAE